jgi:hypothetical protein
MFFQDCLDSVCLVLLVSRHQALFSLNKKQLSQENKLDSLSNRFERVPEKKNEQQQTTVFLSIFLFVGEGI